MASVQVAVIFVFLMAIGDPGVKADVASDRAEISEWQTRAQGVNQGTAYVHWGNWNCDSPEADVVYVGLVAGSAGTLNLRGGSTEYVCLPYVEKPLYDNWSQIKTSHLPHIYGAHFKWKGTSDGYRLKKLRVLCALCLVRNKITTLMIPGRSTCSPGWDLQYSGLLATQGDGKPTQHNYVCMDQEPEAKLGFCHWRSRGPRLYPVKHDNRRNSEKQMSCAVCTWPSRDTVMEKNYNRRLVSVIEPCPDYTTVPTTPTIPTTTQEPRWDETTDDEYEKFMNMFFGFF